MATTQAEVLARIQDWRNAGLLSPEQAAALAAHETARVEVAGGRPTTPRRAIAAEAIGYVGAAFALGALILLLVDVWGGLDAWARLLVASLATVLLLGAGAAVRTVRLAAMQRLTSILWAGAVGTFGWAVGLAGSEYLDLTGSILAQLVSGATFALALPLYLLRRRVVLHVVLFATLLGMFGSTVARLSVLEPLPLWLGLGILGIGAGWALLSAGGWLAPSIVGEALGIVVMLVGTQTMAADEPRWFGLAVGIAISIGLVLVAVRTDERHPLFLGAAGLFIITPQLVFELFADTIGAPATLLVVGLLLVLLAVGISRARREMHGDHETATGPVGAEAAAAGTWQGEERR
jgi:hypothetical protein